MRPSSLIRIKALAVKESLQAVRDPSSILIAFVLPTILLLLFGYGVNLDASRVPIGVALESEAPSARRLAESFRSTAYLAPAFAPHRRELMDKVTNGTLRGLVIIPQDFAERLEQESGSPILVVTDGSETNTANYVRNYASGVLQTWRSVEASSRGETAPRPVELDTRFWYNPELRSRNSLVPGSLAVILAIVGTLLTALVVAREWERGTMEGLLSTPVTPGEFLLSKIVPYLVLGFLSLAASVLISVYVFGVPYRSGIFSLTLAGGAFLLSSLGQGLLISTLTKNQFVASQAALVSGFLPAFLLSGFVFEIASMPWLIRQMTRVIPARYLVTNFQTLFLVGDIWPLVLPNVLFLGVIATLFLGVTLVKSPSRYETH